MRSRSVSSAASAALLAGLLAASSATAGTMLLRAEPFRPLPLLYAAGEVPEGSASGAALPEEGSALSLREAEKQAPDDPATAGTKNPRHALLLSLLLPGAGELYQGHRGRATGFFISEGAIWANFVAWKISGHLRKNDYIEQAQLGAGVGVSSGNDDYWRLIGQYQSSSGTGAGAYEETLRREARTQYPDDPALQDLYVSQRLPTGDRAWNWSTPDRMADYVNTRKNANRAFSRAKYSFGFAVLNRLLSAIDTQILHRSSRGSVEGRAPDRETRVLTSLTADGGGAVLIQRRF